MEFFKVPEPLQREHDLMRHRLDRAVEEGGQTGAAAAAVRGGAALPTSRRSRTSAFPRWACFSVRWREGSRR